MVALMQRPKPAALSPARAALAEAIEKLRTRKREVDATNEVFEKARAEFWAALDAVDRAKEILEDAPASAAAHLVAGAMGEEGEAPLSPAQARAKLVAAEELAASKQAIKEAAEKIANENQFPDVSFYADRVHCAAAAVIAESPELQKIITDIETAQRHLVMVARPLALFFSKSVISETRENYDNPANVIYRKMQTAPFLWQDWHDSPGGSALQWAGTWEALLTDASAPLPASK